MSNKVLLSFTIDPTQRDDLRDRCKKKQVPFSTVLRLLIKGYLDGSIVLPDIVKGL